MMRSLDEEKRQQVKQSHGSHERSKLEQTIGISKNDRERENDTDIRDWSIPTVYSLLAANGGSAPQVGKRKPGQSLIFFFPSSGHQRHSWDRENRGLCGNFYSRGAKIAL